MTNAKINASKNKYQLPLNQLTIQTDNILDIGTYYVNVTVYVPTYKNKSSSFVFTLRVETQPSGIHI